jgi:hypothetical protein
MPSHWGCVDSDLGIGSQQERNQNEYSLQSHREEGQILIDWLVEHNNLYVKVWNKYYYMLTFKPHLRAVDLQWKVLKPSEGTDSQRIPPH